MPPDKQAEDEQENLGVFAPEREQLYLGLQEETKEIREFGIQE